MHQLILLRYGIDYPPANDDSYILNLLMQLTLQVVAQDLRSLNFLILFDYAFNVFVDHELVEGVVHVYALG